MDLSRTSERPQRTVSRKCALCWVMVSILFLMVGRQVRELIYESSWKLKLPLKRSWDMMIWTWSWLYQVDIDASPKWVINSLECSCFFVSFSKIYIYVYICVCFQKNDSSHLQLYKNHWCFFDMFLFKHIPRCFTATFQALKAIRLQWHPDKQLGFPRCHNGDIWSHCVYKERAIWRYELWCDVYIYYVYICLYI